MTNKMRESLGHVVSAIVVLLVVVIGWHRSHEIHKQMSDRLAEMALINYRLSRIESILMNGEYARNATKIEEVKGTQDDN
jgi:fumarate reductase subunit D